MTIQGTSARRASVVQRRCPSHTQHDTHIPAQPRVDPSQCPDTGVPRSNRYQQALYLDTTTGAAHAWFRRPRTQTHWDSNGHDKIHYGVLRVLGSWGFGWTSHAPACLFARRAKGVRIESQGSFGIHRFSALHPSSHAPVSDRLQTLHAATRARCKQAEPGCLDVPGALYEQTQSPLSTT